MKLLSILFTAALLLLLSLPSQSVAQGLPYTEGSVWSIGFVKTVPGMTNDYYKNLADNWMKMNEAAKKEGLVLSYKVLHGPAANTEDWDIMLMVEYKNMAAMDGMAEKMEALSGKLLGSQDTRRVGAEKRNEIREILGGKLAREIILK
jgi:hypothetical protein